MLPGASLLPLVMPLLAAAANPVAVRSNEIEFPATVHAKAFDTDSSMAGYHAIAWKTGRSAHAALFESEVSDTAVLDALESLGARPGNNVPMEAWDKRRDRASWAPDTPMAGPAVEVLLRLPGRTELVPLASVLFGWMLAENAHEAYRLECYLWHAQGGAWARIEGDAHPTPAEKIPFLGCPDCEDD